jgi:hypothetical protein
MSSAEKFNKFNLIPPKSKEEIDALEGRSNSILYSFSLVFFTMLAYFLLTIAQFVVIESRISSNKASIDQKKAEIETYNETKEQNGELFIKSKALEPILARDIKITQLLEISDKLREDLNVAEIINYKREFQGDFVLTLSLEEYTDINQIIENASEIDVVSNLYVRSMSNANGLVTAVISFDITNIDA